MANHESPQSPHNEEMDEKERLSSFSELLGIPFKKHILNDLQLHETPDIPIHYFKR
ncbi:MAG: hypothetical protein GY849_09390, partial [Deltaproteobacteria bacterium]|nr:hypothetical protein [Deltaproteobacteria bacterium]